MKNYILTLIFFVSALTMMAQESVAVYWDASYSMKDRNIEREIQFLENYFKKHQDISVKLLVFSNEIIQEDEFKVTAGNWSSLKQELMNTIYDGASAYDFLFKDNVDEYLLFTDGMENMSKLDPPTTKPIHVISSVDNTNTTDLKLVTDKSEGRFVYLPKDFESKVKEKKELFKSNVQDGFISGVITGAEGNLPNVSVVNQTSGDGVASESDGTYRIEAREGDVLIFSFLGKKTVSIRASQADIINITMADINQRLEEVVLTAEIEAEETETSNIGMEDRDTKSLGYSVESISSEDISELDTDLTRAVSGQFSNFEVKNDVSGKTDISQFLGRGRNMSILLNQYGVVVLDGMPLAQTDSGFGGIAYNQDDIINPDMIESITYLKGLAATNRFGTIGRNGVLLITTKNGARPKSVDDEEAIPLGTTSQYTGNASEISDLPNKPYIEELRKSESVNDAFKTYLVQRVDHGDSPYFYIDVHDYFKGWNNSLISDRILSNVIEIASEDTEALRVVAYKQQENGNFKKAVKTFEHIVKLKPKQSQSYRDLALAYSYAREYQKSLDLYQRIMNNINVGSSDFTGIMKTVRNEMKNLIAQHGSSLNLYGVDNKFTNPVKYRSRIVFEWNELDAEFDVNIVNPQNRFFTWSHTQAENSQMIMQQQEQGFGLEEFYLTSGDLGEWKFNLKYYGKTSNKKVPSYVKITTYDNFGSKNQRMNIKVVRLDKQDIEQTVAKLVVN
ncbi:MAG: carboxypeptidase-like regulatory domain-containing protein [Bacteroidia bacterium]|nr:carboxypeptidase-like regulatory domain-containing protein [Bacteroidia bacterium]MBT8269951.1 carboxypeptidase-like regulatory domain-containing protein [Bacteroidia bacterium]NNK70586.1 TonB-dependent receptor plug domain-containing protein [Flavobacteriaceae bacterium]NNL80329.1 TonB-dependent receptor plug domain-containing protein [Flavobacteriaceae bacterium]